MDTTRVLLWSVGVLLVLGAMFLLFMESGLSRWVSWPVFGAVMLLLLGLFVIGLAKSRRDATGEARVTKVE